MSSERFESLEDDFVSLRNGLTSKLEEHLPRASGQSRKNLCRDAARELDDAQRLAEELEAEVRVAPYAFRMQMNSRLKGYRQDLSTLRKKLSHLENTTSSSSNRSQLFGTSDNQSGGPSALAQTNRGRLLQMNETIDRTTETVYRTHQIAAETDQIGVAVVDELGTQREALVRTKERLVDTDENLSRSRRILRTMHRRVMTNRLILVVIIVLEVAILCGVVYYKFFR